MKTWKRLLLENKAWAQAKVDVQPNYFTDLAQGQTPEYLWIGCSDSRVPAEEITGASPGELFVHRNIANLVVHTDMNLLSVLEYAVEHLKVKHVIVCGHYGCGGVKAAMQNDSYGVLNHWLLHIKDTYRQHKDDVDMLQGDAQVRRMVELNVHRQLANLAKTAVIQRAWRERQAPTLNGWVYDMQSGLINPLMEVTHETDLDPVYRFANGL
mgnify:CR=1 FL=1